MTAELFVFGLVLTAASFINHVKCDGPVFAPKRLLGHLQFAGGFALLVLAFPYTMTDLSLLGIIISTGIVYYIVSEYAHKAAQSNQSTPA